MTRRRAAQACVLLFVLAVGRMASATTSRFELTWRSSSAGRACLAEEELKQAVSARLGRDPFVPVGQGQVVIDGRELPATFGHLRARIAQRDPEGRVLGTRDLDATSCEELRRSATFVVFLIVDPDAAFRTPASPPGHPEKKDADEPRPPSKADEPALAEGQEPPAAMTERRSPPMGPPSRSREVAASAHPPASAQGRGRVRVDLGLALVVSNGLLPTPDVGPALVLGVAPLPLPLRFEWRAAYRLAAQRVEGYDFRAVQQEWRTCYVRRVLGVAFGTACAGAAWTAIQPEARGLARGDQAPKTGFSPTLAVGPTLEIGETRLFADLSLMFPQPRYAFTYRDDGQTMPLHEVSRIAWSLAIGATRSLW